MSLEESIDPVEQVAQETAVEEAANIAKEICSDPVSPKKSRWSTLTEGIAKIQHADSASPEGKTSLIQGVTLLFTGIMGVFGGVKNANAHYQKSKPQQFPKEQLPAAYDKVLTMISGSPELGKAEETVDGTPNETNNDVLPETKAELCCLASGYLREWYAREIDEEKKNTKPIHDGDVVELMAAEERIRPGDVVILDTRKEGMRDSLKRAFIKQGSKGNRVHAMIVETTDPLTFIHSTASGGVHRVVWSKYCSAWSNIDFVVCKTPDLYRDQMVSFAQDKEGCSYDRNGMISDGSSGKRATADNAYYCSELIFEAAKHAGRSLSDSLVSPTHVLDVWSPIYTGSFDGKKAYSNNKKV